MFKITNFFNTIYISKQLFSKTVINTFQAFKNQPPFKFSNVNPEKTKSLTDSTDLSDIFITRPVGGRGLTEAMTKKLLKYENSEFCFAELANARF